MANYSTTRGFEFIRVYNFYDNGLQDSLSHPQSRCLAPTCQCNKDYFNPILGQHFVSSDIGSVAFSLDSSNDDNFVEQKLSRDVGSYIKKEPAERNFEDFLTYDTDIEVSLAANNRNFHLFSESQSYILNYAFLTLSSLLSLVALATLILIVLKMYMRSVKGNQSLGIFLLIGIILLFITTFLFIANPSEIVSL